MELNGETWEGRGIVGRKEHIVEGILIVEGALFFLLFLCVKIRGCERKRQTLWFFGGGNHWNAIKLFHLCRFLIHSRKRALCLSNTF